MLIDSIQGPQRRTLGHEHSWYGTMGGEESEMLSPTTVIHQKPMWLLTFNKFLLMLDGTIEPSYLELERFEREKEVKRGYFFKINQCAMVKRSANRCQQSLPFSLFF